MTWLRKVRPVLFVLGGLLVVGSLLGARALSHGSGGGTDAPKPAPTNGKDGSGPVVLGTVDSEPPPVHTGLPPHLPSGEVTEVFVKAGDQVKVRTVTLWGRPLKVGDPLYKFNTSMPEAKREGAERGVAIARANVRKATAIQAQHKTAIDTQQQKLKVAERQVERTHKGFRVYESNLRKTLTTNHTPDKVKELMADDSELFRLETAYLRAVEELSAEKLALTALETADVGAGVAIAEAEVERAEAMLAEALLAVELCTVRAKVGGTVEQVNVSAGTVMGVSTRSPAVVLVPAGPRVVRAEVEAEFAHRVGPDKIGRDVTIHDNTDPKVTYTGKVRQIGGAFLPKPGAEGGFIPNETRVLPAVVEVADPSPPGKPPLRVGQKVRVNFGQ